MAPGLGKTVAVAIALALAGAAAIGSVGAADLKIEVTGSNIKRTDIEGVAPLEVITREQIERSGQSTLAEVLRSIPANTGVSFNETFTNSFSKGASGISLRGLSEKSTLVLLNGRRMVNYGFAQNLQDTYVDLNGIPAAAVERVEVLLDGASAVYGADAIGGVVNIILRRDYTGAEATVSAGTSSEHDLDERHVSLVGGFGNLASDRFNVLATFDYFKRDQITAADRPFLAGQDFRGIPGGNLDWSASAGTYRRGNDRVPFATCPAGQVRDIHDFPGTAVLSGTACAYNPAPYIPLFPQAERYSGLARGTLDLSKGMQAFVELVLSRTETSQIFIPASISTTSVAFDPTTGGLRRVSNALPIGHPNNPFPTGATSIQYTFFDVGPQYSDITSDSGRLLGGLRGTFRDWDWEVAAGHAQNDVRQVDRNRINAFVFDTLRDSGAYNFLDPSLTPAATDALRINPVRKSTSKLDLADAKITGEALRIPAGPVGFAAGVEYRHESLDDRPDALLTSGATLNQGATGTAGSRDVGAGYLELSVPVIKNMEAQLAARYDHYSDFGGATSPKVGLRWTPVSQLLLRGSYSRGFRAPTLPENSQSSSTFFVNVVDTEPTSQQFNTVARVAAVFQGNPDLKPERSKNYNFGFVLEPVRDVSVGLDYYRIREDNQIAPNGFQFVVDHPDMFPGQVVRDPANNNILISVTDKFRNLVFIDTSGLNLDAQLRARTAALGTFTLAGTWDYLLHYKGVIAVDQPVTEFVDSNASGFTIPRWKGRTSLTWEYGPWTTSATYHYVHSWKQQLVLAPPAQERVGSYKDVDLYVAYEGFKNLKIFGSVQNLFDTNPPFDPSSPTRWDFAQHDWRGRYYTVGLTYKFK